MCIRDSFSIYRNGNKVGQTYDLQFKDSGLNANTAYTYFVTATSNKDIESLPSNSITVKTLGGENPNPEYPEWQTNHFYAKGDGVTYKGKRYICISEHTSNLDWTPDVAFTLWVEVV